MSAFVTADGRTITHRAGLEWPMDDSFRRYETPGGAALSGLIPWANDYELVVETNPWAWAAVRAHSDMIGRFPIRVYNEAVDGERSEVLPGRTGAQRRLALSLRSPKKRLSTRALSRGTVADKLTHGNALWAVTTTGDGRWEFERIPWRNVWPNEWGSRPEYRERCGAKRIFGPDEVIHFGLSDGSSFVSPSPFGALRATMALHRQVTVHLLAYFANGARPSAHLQVDKTTGKEARELVREEIQKLYAGEQNAGRVVITSGEWKQITHDADKSKVVELGHESRDEILAALRVPPPIAGVLDRAIKSNVRELVQFFIRNGAGPEVDFLEGDLMAQLVMLDPVLWPGTYVEWDQSEQLRPDFEAMAKIIKDLAYVFAVNEMRPRLFDLPRIDDEQFDRPWPAPTTSGDTTDPDDDQEVDDDDEDS